MIEAQVCPAHKHMLVTIPPHISVVQLMGFIKRTSTQMIFDRLAELRYKYGSRDFWRRGYYVDTVGRNRTAIQKQIKNQMQEDLELD